jgi:two-component system, sensor histidine kinase and response regulator
MTSAITLTSGRVLIVDDDPALLVALPETVKGRLSTIEVDVCDSPRVALTRIAEVDYDAIITDIRMPGMDGLTLLQKIKAVRPETPTLLITGHGEHSLVVKALRGGAYDFIEKPIDRDYFLASLQRAVQVRQLRRRVEEQAVELSRHAERLEQTVQARTRELADSNRELAKANLAKDDVIKVRDQALADLQKAFAEIKTLTGLLPLCAWCKKVRDDQGYWSQIEVYIRNHSRAEVTHGICPECQDALLTKMSVRS